MSLADYVGRMKEGQDKIYYWWPRRWARRPAARTWRPSGSKGIEVLLLGQDVDNWVVTSLPEFEGKRLQSVAQGAPDFGALADEDEKQAQQQASTQFAGPAGQLKEILGEAVSGTSG